MASRPPANPKGKPALPPGGIIADPRNKTGVTGSTLPNKKLRASVVGNTPPMPQRGIY